MELYAIFWLDDFCNMIYLDKMKEISMLGIRRAAIFMGYGINCVDNNNNNDFHLQKYSPFNFIPGNLNDHIIDEYKFEFRFWIISNGFRELTESFELYLKSIFELCNQIVPSPNKICKEFDYKGINFRLDCLKNFYNIVPNYSEGFQTINFARNCLSHRKGIVNKKDINIIDALEIKWTGYDLKIDNPSGNNTLIDYPITSNIIWEKDGTLLVIPAFRSKIIKLNEVIRFSPKELLEICFYFFNETNVIHNSIIEFLKNKEIKIINK